MDQSFHFQEGQCSHQCRGIVNTQCQHTGISLPCKYGSRTCIHAGYYWLPSLYCNWLALGTCHNLLCSDQNTNTRVWKKVNKLML